MAGSAARAVHYVTFADIASESRFVFKKRQKKRRPYARSYGCELCIPYRIFSGQTALNKELNLRPYRIQKLLRLLDHFLKCCLLALSFSQQAVHRCPALTQSLPFKGFNVTCSV